MIAVKGILYSTILAPFVVPALIFGFIGKALFWVAENVLIVPVFKFLDVTGLQDKSYESGRERWSAGRRVHNAERKLDEFEGTAIPDPLENE